MNVVVTGASGMIGSSLLPALAARGHRVWRAVRRPPAAADEVQWDVATGALRPPPDGRPDAIVHLAGESLAGRWTRERKRRAWTSRVDATRRLAETLAGEEPPPLLVAASAVDYYGDRGDEWLDEDSPRGRGFLADLVTAWEGAAAPLRRRGAEVRQLRIGLVLSTRGGALTPLLATARLGLGGPLGNGRQFWSWIAIEDLILVLVHVLELPQGDGVWNAVGPEPVRQSEFARTLGRVLGRPAFLPAPALALRLLLGEMASLPLASHRVRPARLTSEAFGFRHAWLEEALRSLLKKPAAASDQRGVV